MPQSEGPKVMTVLLVVRGNQVTIGETSVVYPQMSQSSLESVMSDMSLSLEMRHGPGNITDFLKYIISILLPSGKHCRAYR